MTFSEVFAVTSFSSVYAVDFEKVNIAGWFAVMRYCLVNKQLFKVNNLVPFVQFAKREKHPWRSVTLSKVAGHADFSSWQLYLK